MKKRGPKPYSLHLDHIIQKAIATHQKRDQYLRVQKDIFVLKVLTWKMNMQQLNCLDLQLYASRLVFSWLVLPWIGIFELCICVCEGGMCCRSVCGCVHRCMETTEQHRAVPQRPCALGFSFLFGFETGLLLTENSPPRLGPAPALSFHFCHHAGMDSLCVSPVSACAGSGAWT